jgi:hypothetical protein
MNNVNNINTEIYDPPNNKPNSLVEDWSKGLDFIAMILGENYYEFINEFHEFKNKHVFSYAIVGEYAIVCASGIYDKDKYLAFINRRGALRDSHVAFDTSKYIQK